jgi:hypothetical protein
MRRGNRLLRIDERARPAFFTRLSGVEGLRRIDAGSVVVYHVKNLRHLAPPALSRVVPGYLAAGTIHA